MKKDIITFPDFDKLDLRIGEVKEASLVEGSKNLIWFGIFITLYTITSLIISFYLSIDKTKVVVLPLIFAVFQVIGIYMFHNTILEVVKISILATSLLLVSLFIYFVYGIKKLEAKIK